uniref:Uncharacterized protein n=1 Tax=Arundo donax TaxID=35708 RepID=A0A0A9HA16_ARUDO
MYICYYILLCSYSDLISYFWNCK